MRIVKTIYTKCISQSADVFMKSFGFHWNDKEFCWEMEVDFEYDLSVETVDNIKNTFPESSIYEAGKDRTGTRFHLRIDLREQYVRATEDNQIGQ